MDPNQIRAFMDHVGVPEENLAWALQYKDMPNYFNAMKY